MFPEGEGGVAGDGGERARWDSCSVRPREVRPGGLRGCEQDAPIWHLSGHPALAQDSGAGVRPRPTPGVKPRPRPTSGRPAFQAWVVHVPLAPAHPPGRFCVRAVGGRLSAPGDSRGGPPRDAQFLNPYRIRSFPQSQVC